MKAYRAVWEAENGPVPDGMELDHLCFNRWCVRPDHLEPVPPEVNRQRFLEAIESGVIIPPLDTSVRRTRWAALDAAPRVQLRYK